MRPWEPSASQAVSGAGTGVNDGGDDVIRLGGLMSLSGSNADFGWLYKNAHELTIGQVFDRIRQLRDLGVDPTQ